MSTDVEKNQLPNFFKQGAYGCVSYPRIDCSGKRSKRDKREISKVVLNGFIAKNELQVGEKVRKIKQAPKHMFITFHRHCSVKKDKFKKDKDFYQSCKLFRKARTNSGLIIMYSPYIPSITVHEYLKICNYEKLFDLYGFMLHAISLLLKKRIVHHDVKSNNIIFSKVTEDFSLIDFGMALDLDKCVEGDRMLNISLLRKLLPYNPKYHLHSMESHILSYYFKYGTMMPLDTLKYTIQVVMTKSVTRYIYSMTEMFEFYKKKLYLTDLSDMQLMRALFLESCKTWDLYGMAYICCEAMYGYKLELFKPFESLLCDALHYDYTKRPNIEVQLKRFYPIVIMKSEM